MNWRPEGWKNPFSVSAGADPADGERYIDFEAGADAMLTAISEEIEKVENPYTLRGNEELLGGFEDCRKKILALLKGKETHD